MSGVVVGLIVLFAVALAVGFAIGYMQGWDDGRRRVADLPSPEPGRGIADILAMGRRIEAQIAAAAALEAESLEREWLR